MVAAAKNDVYTVCVYARYRADLLISVDAQPLCTQLKEALSIV